MFLDEATIEVQAGNGGRGCVSWRREKYVPRGGPSGGDGGRGGDIVLLADENTDTLSHFASRKRFEAENGGFGSGSNKHGGDGEDLVLHVPPGTHIALVAEDGSREAIADLQHHGDQAVVARGGRGGYGNAHFKSSVRQKPDFAELGEPGEQMRLHLELKLVADVGIIGFPSVGKSTLISVISAAKPKIAAYPFTTLVPNLGVVSVDDGRSYVVCDVPGLIEGASEGKGLGDTFLRHIERTGVLLHVLDVTRALGEGNSIDAAVLLQDYRAIRKELSAYSPLLAEKRELVLLNKIDIAPEASAAAALALADNGVRIFAQISAVTRTGTDDLVRALFPIVQEARQERRKAQEADAAADAAALPVLRPGEEEFRMGAYSVERDEDGSARVRGARLEQFTIMTDFSNRGAIERFRDVAERVGLKKALRRAGVTDGVPVYIGKVRVEGYL